MTPAVYPHYNDVPKAAWPCRHFTPREIACRGDDSVLVHFDALEALDAFRVLVGGPMRLSSAYRSPYHNAEVGGAPLSSHLEGHAFDIRLDGRDKGLLRGLAEKVGFRGFGMKYQSFIHIDRGRERAW